MVDLAKLNTQLLEGDLITRGEAAEALARQRTKADTAWTITIFDKLWTPVGVLGDDLIELQGDDPRNDLGTATIKVKGDSRFIGHLMTCASTMVGITVEVGGLRWAYYVDTFDWEFQGGQWIGIANCHSIFDILNYLVVWPDFLLPIQTQIWSHAIFAWALCTVIESMIAECAFRIQTGLWEFINNAASLDVDIRTWFGTLLQGTRYGTLTELLKCPVYVVRTNPLTDGSPFVARTVRMETCATVIRDITKAYGVDIRVDLWLPGDPQPDWWTQNFEFLALHLPTYVVSTKDRSQISGPTHTALDSVIREVVDIGGSFFGEVGPIIRQVPGMEGTYYSLIVGQNYTPPWAVFTAPYHGEKGNVVSCKVNHHTPKGWQHIIGGRSPKWLNDLLNAFYAWIIDSISILIGFTGIPSSLLEGFLNDAILAFQLIQSYERRDACGPYHPAVEVMHATQSSPYNIEALFDFVNAFWDSRGWVSAQVVIRNGEVFTLGKDVFRGGLASVVYPAPGAENATGATIVRKRLYTDYVENVTFHVTEDARDLMIQIGDGRAKEAPLAKYQRTLTGLFEAVNVAVLTPQSSGLL